MKYLTNNELCEMVSLDKISLEIFNETYKRFYYALIGYLRTGELEEKKILLDLAQAIMDAKVQTSLDLEEEQVISRKNDILTALDNIQARGR